jgi:hypothetical protein
MGAMAVHADREEQGDQDDPSTDPEATGEKTGDQADEDELPGPDRRSFVHHARLGVVSWSFAPP